MNISKLCIRSSRIIYEKRLQCLARCHSSDPSSIPPPKAANKGKDDARNPTPVFFAPEIQRLLKELTAINLQKVFQQRKDQQKLKTPSYQFMTTEELKKALQDAQQRGEERLQMPPVLLSRTPIESELTRDPVLKGYCKSKFVFTDITYGISNHDRWIVVRDSDGTLRKASREERDRINQTYFPLPGRSWKTPKMFEKEYLENLLNRGEYEFILDRACLQFEPDDPQYISVTHKVYDHLDDKRDFDCLRSTRHFGPLAFYLAWNQKIDSLVLECIQNDRIDDAVRAIQLLHYIHPSLKSASTPLDPNNKIQFIKAYIAKDSARRSSLELAIQSYEELSKQRQQITHSLEEAHGHN